MTVVVADTSPLNYLVLIDAIELLPRLYRRIVIPTEVLNELIHQRAPRPVSEWANRLPEWVEVRSLPPADDDPELSLLDLGEKCAILLAQSESEVLLLIDESAGRLEASRRGIPNTGTLGVLRAASLAQLVDLPSVLARLVATSFRISKPLVDGLIAEHTARERERMK
jgi:predicted nucleic acid-binding protein